MRVHFKSIIEMSLLSVLECISVLNGQIEAVVVRVKPYWGDL